MQAKLPDMSMHLPMGRMGRKTIRTGLGYVTSFRQVVM